MNLRQTAEQEAEIQSGPDPLAFDEERPSEEEMDVSAPRTWTMRGHEDEHGHREVVVDVGPPLKADRKYINCESVRVIELKPVLNLLERLKEALETARFGPQREEPDRTPSLEAARALLRNHGRLDG